MTTKCHSLQFKSLNSATVAFTAWQTVWAWLFPASTIGFWLSFAIAGFPATSPRLSPSVANHFILR